MGLYLSIGGLVFLFIGTLLQIANLTPDASALASFVQSLTTVFAIIGYVLGTIGVVGLIIKRMTDQAMNDYTVGIDYMNLIWLGAYFCHGLPCMAERPRLRDFAR